MKNIIVVGAPKSGMTTLSRMIMEKFSNYNIVSGDVIKGAFIGACIDQNETVIKMNIAEAMTLQCFDQSIYYEKPYNFILDLSDTNLDKLKEYNDYIIIVLGIPDLSPDELFDKVRTYDNEYDWTYIESDSHLYRYCDHFIKRSKYYEEECKKMNLPFYNVSEGREKVFEKILDEIEDKIYK